jgi:hypothetical protein
MIINCLLQTSQFAGVVSLDLKPIVGRRGRHISLLSCNQEHCMILITFQKLSIFSILHWIQADDIVGLAGWLKKRHRASMYPKRGWLFSGNKNPRFWDMRISPEMRGFGLKMLHFLAR